MSDFGRYKLLRRVGAGGMAEVWKASVQGPAGFEKQVAIKKILPDLLENTEFIEMFINEAKLVGGLTHPNIVQVFDFGQVGSDYFMAMEYVAGTNLARVLSRLSKRKVRLPLEVALYVAAEASRGLGYAHARNDAAGRSLGIIHRDVSPQNLLVSFDGEVKVTDFGIAKMSSAISRTTEGHVRGKLAYMSPEQASAGPLDPRTDLFSLALVLWEMLTGGKLFGGSDVEVYSGIMRHTALSPAQLEAVPAVIRDFLRKALHPLPIERHANAREFEAELNATLTSDGHFLGRDSLGSILRETFQEERQLENTPVPAENPTAGFAPTGGLPLGFAAGSMAQVEESATGVLTGSSAPSGLTVVPQKVIQREARSLPPRPAPAAERGRSLLWWAGPALAVIGVATWLAPAFVRSPATPTPAAVHTPMEVAVVPTAPPTPKPVPTRLAVAPGKPGTLTVTAAPWVEVWIDGKRIAKETPLRRFALPSGRHTLRVANPALRFSMEKVVNVPPDGTATFFVDVRKGTIEVE